MLRDLSIKMIVLWSGIDELIFSSLPLKSSKESNSKDIDKNFKTEESLLENDLFKNQWSSIHVK
jgi:hypothetical protein